MPDLGNLSFSSSLTLTRCPSLISVSPESADSTEPLCVDSVKTLAGSCNREQRPVEKAGNASNANGIRVFRRRRGGLDKGMKGINLEDHVKEWVKRKVVAGVPESRCFLPFLVGSKKMVECLVCNKLINPGEEVLCSVRGCQGGFHSLCAKEELGISNLSKFRCPQHECFVCKQRIKWRCVRCIIATHDKHAAWPDQVIHLKNQVSRAVCWRHPTDWRIDKKLVEQNAVAGCEMEEVFNQLPLPYEDEEFKIDLIWKDLMNKEEPPPYVHIRRNIYLVKKKRDNAYDDVGCTNCGITCSKSCVCRVQCISCSRVCHCPETCGNRPFRKEKKIKLVKTEFCGWGVVAAEPINKGDFIIEYIGEVISDAQCEQRLWDMKHRGLKNFYMCEIRKNFTIDATFKGNASRFLNHGCDPNCILEKWQVDGETRVGVFAAWDIEVGEPLTYDYRFVQFGPEVKCHCGAQNCHGYLGMKRKVVNCFDVSWGAKRRRGLHRVLSPSHNMICFAKLIS